MSERKQISIRNLKVGDMVVGEHVDNITWSYNVVAGKITSISKSKEAFTQMSDLSFEMSIPT